MFLGGLFTRSYVDAGGEKYGARRIRKTVYLVSVLFCSACGIPSNCCFDTVQLGWILQYYINIYKLFYSSILTT